MEGGEGGSDGVAAFFSMEIRGEKELM